MKTHLFVSAMLAMALYACGPVYVVHQDPPPSATPAPPLPPESEPDASYQSFYDDLSPYGQWIDDPDYGYVWLPDAGPDFKPYATNGHWVYTDDGWTWASDYPWGWAAFHYGRWFFQDGYGWMWVPGNEWAPAWVTWRNNDQYYGWAPMEPGISFDVSFGGGYEPPPHYWSFVPHQYVGSPQIRNYYVADARNVTIIRNTTVINYKVRNADGSYTRNSHVRNTGYGRGPDPAEVGRYTGAAVRPVAIRPSNAPGEQMRDGNLSIYRPRINPNPRNAAGNGGSQPRMAPSRPQPLNNARPVNTSVYGGNPRNSNGQPATRDDRNNNGQPARSNPPVNQPAAPPARQTVPPPPVMPPARQPATPPAQRRATPPPAVRPAPPARQPLPPPAASPAARPAAPPARQPMTRPDVRPARQQPANPPVRQQNPHPPAVNRNPPPPRPAVQPPPARQPAPPPPPPPAREQEKKDRS